MGLVALVVAPLACNEPQVDVTVKVGDPEEDPEVRTEQAREVARTLLEGLSPTETAAPSTTPSKQTSIVLADAPTSGASLRKVVKALRRSSHAEIEGPARRIAAAGPDAWPVVRELLIAERRAPKGDYRSVLGVIGGDVPNRYGYFARHWKRAHGFKVKLSEDWFEDLLKVPSGHISRGLRAVYRDCVLEAALLRATASIGQTADAARAAEVVDALLDAAYLHAGTFRDEVGRAIQAVGDPAVPALVRAGAYIPRRARDEEKPEAKRAAYARYQLDAMDRLHPERAVAAIQEDPRRLVELLESYGKARTPEAASSLLRLVDAPTPSVRNAAREAFLAYVTGPAPRLVTRKVRLLGGGTGKARAYLSYRARADLAVRERLESQWPELAEPVCSIRREDGTDDPHCEAQPERHTQLLFAKLDEERTERQARALEVALQQPQGSAQLEALDTLLAEDPSIGERPEMVAAYVRGGAQAQEASDPKTAARLFRKAAALLETRDSERADALRKSALLQEASLPDLPAHGRAMLLRSAGESTAGTRERSPSSVSTALRLRVAVSLVLGAVGLLLIGWIGRPLRARIWRA